MEEKDNAANKTHNGDGGDNGRRNGLGWTDHWPRRWFNRSGTKERWWSVCEILGKFRHNIPAGDGATLDRKALQEGKLAARSSIDFYEGPRPASTKGRSCFS